jgi:hypothetical protein
MYELYVGESREVPVKFLLKSKELRILLDYMEDYDLPMHQFFIIDDEEDNRMTFDRHGREIY